MTGRTKWLLIALIGLLVFNMMVLVALQIARQSSEVVTGVRVVRTGTADIGGPFSLVTADGKAVTDKTYRDKWMLIYFGYTFCPDACPTALANMSIALEKLGKEAERFQPLFITVDPERDTPKVMGAFLESFDRRIVGLTGTQAQTDAVTKVYRVYYKLHKEQGQNYLVEHSAYFYIMGPDGKFVDVVEGATPGDQVADKLRTMLAEHSTTAAVAATDPGGIAVEHAWARASPKGAVTGGAYVTIVNNGSGDDRLLGVSSPAAERIQFHSETNDNGIAKMVQLQTIDVPAGGSFTFKPGGTHMMMTGLKQPLREGETVQLFLKFEKAGVVEATARIGKIAAMGDPGDQASNGN